LPSFDDLRMPVLNWMNKEKTTNSKDRKSDDSIELGLQELYSRDFHFFSADKIDVIPNRKPIKLKDYLAKNWHNLLILGENAIVMKSLLNFFTEKINLIYIDPPFATGADFSLKMIIGEDGQFENELSYSDHWDGGIDSYLHFLYERFSLMKQLLANQGSIYVHLDWHSSHYIKLILDELFGINNFRNEIIWAYPAASAQTRRFFIRSYDVILFYTKSDDYIFNDDPKIYMEYSARVKNALKRDEHGIFYYRGGSHDGKKLTRKVYIEQDGTFPRDLWNDIPFIRANTKEYHGFPTQKPERLLKRIILASSNENDIVADFFCGTGTCLVAAEKLNRRWIGCDIASHATSICKKRLLNISASNDLIEWKSPYHQPFKPFMVLSPQFKNPQDHLNVEKKQPCKNHTHDISFGLEIKKHLVRNELVIEVVDYVPPINVKANSKFGNKVKKFSDWIDFWAIDFNYQNNLFRVDWTSFRTPRNRDLKLKSLPYHYNDSGSYSIAIKIRDITGFEDQKVYLVKIE
jgi:DNA modification methylase